MKIVDVVSKTSSAVRRMKGSKRVGAQWSEVVELCGDPVR